MSNREHLTQLEQQQAALIHEDNERAQEAQRRAYERQRLAQELSQAALNTAESELEANAQKNAGLLEDNNIAADALQASLTRMADEIDQMLLSIAPQAGAVEETFEVQANHVKQARRQMAAVLRQHGQFSISAMDNAEAARGLAVQRELSQRVNLTYALPLERVIQQWISEEPDPDRRRLRAALGYTLTGLLYEPDGPISRDELRSAVKQQQQPSFF